METASNQGNEPESRFYEQIGVAMTCRSFEEYIRMFALEESRLRQGEALDVAAGASSFVAGARSKGIRATAVDPMYRMSTEEIEAHGKSEIVVSTDKLTALADKLDLSYYGNMNNHRANRERSLEMFVGDYSDGVAEGRYVSGMLPDLPFEDGRFGTVLCSHFLFLYAEQFGYDFHLDAIRELLRVCEAGGEVCIYPLINLKWKPVEYLTGLIEELCRTGECQAVLEESNLPFIPGSTKLLRLRKISL